MKYIIAHDLGTSGNKATLFSEEGKLMGSTVYESGIKVEEGAHVYCHSRKDGKDGCVYLVINNSAEATTVQLPKAAEVYALTGNGKIRSRTMLLNGRELVLGENDELPELTGVTMDGTVEVAPGGCTFFVL
jgi:glycerol kinase